MIAVGLIRITHGWFSVAVGVWIHGRGPGAVLIHRQTAYSFTLRKRRALVMTETELKLMATPAIIGLSSTPKNG